MESWGGMSGFLLPGCASKRPAAHFKDASGPQAYSSQAGRNAGRTWLCLNVPGCCFPCSRSLFPIQALRWPTGVGSELAVSQPSPATCQSSASCWDLRSQGLLHPQWLHLCALTFSFEVKPFPSCCKEKIGGSHTGCPEPLCPAWFAEPKSDGDIIHWSVCAFCLTAKSYIKSNEGVIFEPFIKHRLS